MFAFLIVMGFVLGAAVGSFLNVVIARVPAGESLVRPRSHCVSCGHAIRARHNVPIASYVALGGRCADCGARIGWRYPIVEATTAAGFAAVVVLAWHRELLPLLPAWWYFVAIGIALSAIDIAVHRLPNPIVLPSYPVFLVLLIAASILSGDWWALARAGIGLGVLLLGYASLALLYPAGMGWGDVKLAGIIGAVTGYVGWAALIVGAFSAFALGAVMAVVVMALGRGTGKTALPFGPFMLLGAVLGVVFGGYIAGGYLGMIGV